MKKINTLQLVIAFTFFLVSCNKRGSGMAEADYDVIPLPNHISVTKETAFMLSESTKIVFPAENKKMQRNAEFLAEYLKQSSGIQTDVTTMAPGRDAITLSAELQHDNPEAYHIEINEREIRIR